ncbi:IclR family transcriptional regulator [Pseudomonadota bacterium]
MVIQSNIGGSAPAYCVSSGKAMIAFDADRLEKVIGEGLKRFTANTITDPKKLRDTCQEIREKGYAINNGEYRIDAMGVGSPIFDSRNQVVGAISSVAPLSRMNKKQWRLHIESVLSTAERISQRLGKSQK